MQVLCCEVEGLLTQLLGNESTMDLLFSLLQQVNHRLSNSGNWCTSLMSAGHVKPERLFCLDRGLWIEKAGGKPITCRVQCRRGRWTV